MRDQMAADLVLQQLLGDAGHAATGISSLAGDGRRDQRLAALAEKRDLASSARAHRV